MKSLAGYPEMFFLSTVLKVREFVHNERLFGMHFEFSLRIGMRQTATIILT